MAKREITCKINAEDLTVTWSADGQEDLVLHADKVHENMQTYAALHGFKQRITDAAALDKGASVREKFAEMAELVAYYESGADKWERAGRGGGGFKLDSGLVVECVASVMCAGDVDRANRLIDQLAAKRDISRDEAIKVFYDTDTVKPEYATRAARRNAKGNASALIAELESA